MKKRILILSVIFFVLQGCLDLRTCDLNKLPGRYYCYNNENAINWIDIHKDGTFYHYYKEGDVKISHNGKWKQDEKNGCVIELDEWKTFNESGKDYQFLGSMYLWITGNRYLDIGPDGETSTSFEKSDEDMSVNPLDKN
ncbi:hypothetical protein AAON49_00715 [Pseudotenacibaculum sp. MALMAid0570]|uniref:hypothetical protein n=1 Tax=Pseudotenacibaculum sp. MALMAid0570 TaxID=3143938 RepID=UPI0032E035A2